MRQYEVCVAEQGCAVSLTLLLRTLHREKSLIKNRYPPTPLNLSLLKIPKSTSHLLPCQQGKNKNILFMVFKVKRLPADTKKWTGLSAWVLPYNFLYHILVLTLYRLLLCILISLCIFWHSLLEVCKKVYYIYFVRSRPWGFRVWPQAPD